MEITKRTLNWLPRQSLYAEAEAQRVKRKSYAQSDIAQAASINANLISGNTSTTGDSINLTLRIAATRLQTGTTKKV